jgi:DNA-binding cell septation regulator SpoVG
MAEKKFWEYSKQFSSTYQPKKNGRKPSHLRKWIKDNNISTDDIRRMIGSLGPMIKTIDDAKELLEKEDTPFIVKLFLKPIIQDFVKGSTKTIQWMIEYGFGMPKQEIESTETKITAKDIPREDRKKMLSDLMRKYNETEEGKENEAEPETEDN